MPRARAVGTPLVFTGASEGTMLHGMVAPCSPGHPPLLACGSCSLPGPETRVSSSSLSQETLALLLLGFPCVPRAEERRG